MHRQLSKQLKITLNSEIHAPANEKKENARSMNFHKETQIIQKVMKSNSRIIQNNQEII